MVCAWQSRYSSGAAMFCGFPCDTHIVPTHGMPVCHLMPCCDACQPWSDTRYQLCNSFSLCNRPPDLTFPHGPTAGRPFCSNSRGCKLLQQKTSPSPPQGVLPPPRWLHSRCQSPCYGVNLVPGTACLRAWWPSLVCVQSQKHCSHPWFKSA